MLTTEPPCRPLLRPASFSSFLTAHCCNNLPKKPHLCNLSFIWVSLLFLLQDISFLLYTGNWMDPDSVIISEVGLLWVLLAIYHPQIPTQRSGVTCLCWRNTYFSYSSSGCPMMHQPQENNLCCLVHELLSASWTWQHDSDTIKSPNCRGSGSSLAEKPQNLLFKMFKMMTHK